VLAIRFGDMRTVIEVVSQASVTAEKQCIGEITGPGLRSLWGHHEDNNQTQADEVVNKILNISNLGKEHSALELNAPVLVVSQFTLYADVRTGRRPSWSNAARPEQSEPLYEYFVHQIRNQGLEVETGQLGAMMDISLTNTAPFTLVIDSDDLAAPRRG